MYAVVSIFGAKERARNLKPRYRGYINEDCSSWKDYSFTSSGAVSSSGYNSERSRKKPKDIPPCPLLYIPKCLVISSSFRKCNNLSPSWLLCLSSSCVWYISW